MPTIADALAANNPADPAQTAGTSGGVGTTQRLSQILQQTSGKAAAAGGPATQNFAEDAGVAGVRQQAGAAQSQQGLQTAQLANADAAQKSGAANATAASNQKFSAAADEYANRAGQLLAQFTQGGQQIDLQRNQLAANQLALNMRLSSEKYATRLAEEGQVRRLSDGVGFQENTAKAVMGAELDALHDKLSFEDVMTTSQDQYDTILAHMSVGDMIQIAQLQNKSAAANQAFGAIPTAFAGAGKLAGASSSDPNAATRAQNEQQPNFVGPTSDNAGGN